MPSMPREISWLSPKRRRTTGNLKTLPNVENGTEGRSTTPNSEGGFIPGPEQSPSTTTPSRRVSQPLGRPLSQPLESSTSPDPSGNLFYAYARRGDNVHSNYLLTFASATIANEWWLLLQTYFSDCARPGPQLFSFRDPDLLSKAWKHASFAHLKNKWMYISFADTPEKGLGGAAQGIIPVQDAQGHMLGGSAPASPELLGQVGQVRREAKVVRNEITKLEEYFERMMEAVEKNTEQVAHLAAERQLPANEERHSDDHPGRPDASKFSSYLGQINSLLSLIQGHVEGLSNRQHDNDQKLRVALEDIQSREKNDYLDMSQLSTHLDRIQNMMEQSIKERKDSARASTEQQMHTANIDFSPLVEKLGKMQEAVEQSSALTNALLGQSSPAGSEPGTTSRRIDMPVPHQIDISPLADHLQKIHAAIEQQSNHMQSLNRFTGVDGEGTSVDAPVSRDNSINENGLASFHDHFQHIYSAIQEGNKHVKCLPQLPDHLDKIHISTERNETYMQQLLDKHDNLRVAIKTASESTGLAPLSKKLDGLNEHLEVLREWTEFDSEQLKELVEAQKATGTSLIAQGDRNLDPVTERLDQILETQKAARATANAEGNLSLAPLAEKLDVLCESVDALRRSSDSNAEQLRSLLESQQEAAAANPPSSEIDFTPLTDRLNRIHASLDKQAERDLQFSGSGDPKFLMSALTSHLSKIQSVTEANARHIKSLHERHSATQGKMHIAVSQTADQVRALTEHTARNDARLDRADVRLDATNGQVRELMAGQREMVDAVRALAKSIAMQQNGACDHVVIPPPRKVGRKVVGFVYDGTDGPL